MSAIGNISIDTMDLDVTSTSVPFENFASWRSDVETEMQPVNGYEIVLPSMQLSSLYPEESNWAFTTKQIWTTTPTTVSNNVSNISVPVEDKYAINDDYMQGVLNGNNIYVREMEVDTDTNTVREVVSLSTCDYYYDGLANFSQTVTVQGVFDIRDYFILSRDPKIIRVLVPGINNNYLGSYTIYDMIGKTWTDMNSLPVAYPPVRSWPIQKTSILAKLNKLHFATMMPGIQAMLSGSGTVNVFPKTPMVPLQYSIYGYNSSTVYTSTVISGTLYDIISGITKTNDTVRIYTEFIQSLTDRLSSRLFLSTAILPMLKDTIEYGGTQSIRFLAGKVDNLKFLLNKSYSGFTGNVYVPMSLPDGDIVRLLVYIDIILDDK